MATETVVARSVHGTLPPAMEVRRAQGTLRGRGAGVADRSRSLPGPRARPVVRSSREQGLVADVQLKNQNNLTHNRTYSKVGSTGLLAADPAVVHFGGFTVGEVYTLTLRIRNTSTAGTRVHIVPPTTPFFKVGGRPAHQRRAAQLVHRKEAAAAAAQQQQQQEELHEQGTLTSRHRRGAHRARVQARCDDKKGLLAPGMAEQVEVEFCPQGYKYYHDTIRIHSEARDGPRAVGLAPGSTLAPQAREAALLRGCYGRSSVRDTAPRSDASLQLVR